MLSRTNHQGGERSLRVGCWCRRRTDGAAASGTVGGILPAGGEEEELQRGGGGNSAEAGGDCLAHAQGEPTVSLRAQPEPTKAKLQRLRVQATGERRKSGPAKGSAAAGPTPEPTRTVKSLPQVYADEGVPAMTPPPAGEARTVTESGTQAYVDSLKEPKCVPRTKRQQPKPSTTPA